MTFRSRLFTGLTLAALLPLGVFAYGVRREMTRRLTEDNARILYIPTGFAHGFASLADRSIVVYNVSSVYNPAHDTGVRWDSFGFSWPVERPVISDRDAALVPLAEFQSPFSLQMP